MCEREEINIRQIHIDNISKYAVPGVECGIILSTYNNIPIIPDCSGFIYDIEY